MTKKDLIKFVSAFTMGDGGVYYVGKHCRFIKNQLADNSDFLEWQADVLSNITSVNITDVHDLRQNRKPSIRICTKSHPTYTAVRERLYIGTYKSVDPHYLKLLDWQALACLYMDDGSLNTDSRCNATPTARLNTKRLSYADSLLLKEAIRDRLSVEFNIHSHYHRYFLTLRAKDSDTFFKNIRPYIFKSFEYKLP